MYRLLAKLIVFCNLLLPPDQSAASQQCNMTGFAGHYMQAYRNRVVLNDCYHQLIGDMDQARRAQQTLIALMEDSFQPAGYKVGLTDRKAQEMFGLTQPLVGVLFKHMLLPDGAVIEQDSATSLLVELDLMLRVRSAEINQANSIEDIARHIDAIIPFIELPDAMFRLDSQNASALLFAGNVGARWGVTGAPLTVVQRARPDRVSAGPDFAVIDGYGRGPTRGTGQSDPGSSVAFYPLSAARIGTEK